MHNHQLKNRVLAIQDCRVIPFRVPEWDLDVHLRQWTGKERACFQSYYAEAVKDPDKMSQLLARVCVLSLCNEDGERLFGDEDIESVNEKSAKALDSISVAALRHNSITPDASEDARADFSQARN